MQALKAEKLSDIELAVARHGMRTLTRREREIIAHVCSGKTAKEIGLLLHCSYRTVESHRMRAMGKLGVHRICEIHPLLTALSAASGQPEQVADPA